MFLPVAVRLSASVERFGVSRIRDFFWTFSIWNFVLPWLLCLETIHVHYCWNWQYVSYPFSMYATYIKKYACILKFYIIYIYIYIFLKYTKHYKSYLALQRPIEGLEEVWVPDVNKGRGLLVCSKGRGLLPVCCWGLLQCLSLHCQTLSELSEIYINFFCLRLHH